MESFSGAGQVRIDGKRTAVRAKEMVTWLERSPSSVILPTENITGEKWKDKIKGRTGIIYFGNYWARSSAEDKTKSRSGDHIDLWNGSRTTVNDVFSFSAHIGRGIGIPEVHVGDTGYSNIDKAHPILFWEIK